MKNQIIKNLEMNGYPAKSVSLPLEKMYEVADKKGENLNMILEELATEGTTHIKTADKIVFEKVKASEKDFGLDPEMIKKAEEMMGGMKPEDIQKMQEQLAAMSPEEKEKLMEQAKSMGLV